MRLIVSFFKPTVEIRLAPYNHNGNKMKYNKKTIPRGIRKREKHREWIEQLNNAIRNFNNML